MTASVSSKTSLSQNRSTRKPRDSSHLVRRRSCSSAWACWLPSTSITRCALRQDRDLAAKAITRYLLSAQPHPKALLGVGHRSSKPSGPLNIGARRDRHVSHCNRTPTLPSPVNGGGK